MRDVRKSELGPTAIQLLKDCGEDAQDHPLVADGDVLRFKANPVIRLIVDRWVNLNELSAAIQCMGYERSVQLGFRAFYRDMGYSLGGYLEIFGEALDEEEQTGMIPKRNK